jgi:hypothetical protein
MVLGRCTAPVYIHMHKTATGSNIHMVWTPDGARHQDLVGLLPSVVT